MRPPLRPGYTLALLALFSDAALAGNAVRPPPGDTSLTLETLTATRLRPLFSPTRHPPIVPVAAPPPQPPEPVAPTPPPPTATLIGVVIGPSTRMAIVTSGSAEKPVTVRPGLSLGGWTVENIEPDRVVLAYQSDRFTLLLRRGQNRTDASPIDRGSPAARSRPPRRDPLSR